MFGTDRPGVLRSEIYWLCDDCAVMFRLSRDPQTGIVCLRRTEGLQSWPEGAAEPSARSIRSAWA